MPSSLHAYEVLSRYDLNLSMQSKHAAELSAPPAADGRGGGAEGGASAGLALGAWLRAELALVGAEKGSHRACRAT